MSDLISRQEALKTYQNIVCKGICCADCRAVDRDGNCVVEDWIESLPSAQQWISCNERLPKEEKNKYWICTDTEYQCSCRWTNDNLFWHGETSDWHWNLFDIPQYSKVVAWMPLPQPWKGKKDEG